MSSRPNRAAFLSTVTYAGVSLAAATTFFLVTTFAGDYPWVARLGGAGWIFFLSMIILMPTLAPWLRGQLEGR